MMNWLQSGYSRATLGVCKLSSSSGGAGGDLIRFCGYQDHLENTNTKNLTIKVPRSTVRNRRKVWDAVYFLHSI